MGFYIDEARHGMGMHGADIPPEVMKKQMKVSIGILASHFARSPTNSSRS